MTLPALAVNRIAAFLLVLVLLYVVAVPLRNPAYAQCPGTHQLLRQEGQVSYHHYSGPLGEFDYQSSPDFNPRNFYLDVKIAPDACSLIVGPRTIGEEWYALLLPASWRWGLYYQQLDASNVQSTYSSLAIYKSKEQTGDSLDQIAQTIIEDTEKSNRLIQNETRPYRQSNNLAHIDQQQLQLGQQRYLEVVRTHQEQTTINVSYFTLVDGRQYYLGWTIFAPNKQEAQAYRDQYQSQIRSLLTSLQFK